MRIDGKKYVVVFSLDTGFIMVNDIFDDANSAYGCALISLQQYADDQDDYEDNDLYFTTIYSLEGDTGFGISLMLRGSKTENGTDKELAYAWVLIKE